MIESIQHALGLCGDGHFSFMSLFVESQNIQNILIYIRKLLFKH